MNTAFKLLRITILLTAVTSCTMLVSDNIVSMYINNIITYIAKEYLRNRDPNIPLTSIFQQLINATRSLQNISQTYPAIEEALGRLNEPHTSFFTPEEVKYLGYANDFGIQVVVPENIIVGIFPGSSADKSGLRVGDKVIGVNFKPFNSGDPLFRIDANSYLLTVTRRGVPDPITVNLLRYRFPVNLPPKIYSIEGKIGIIELPSHIGNGFFEGLGNYKNIIFNEVKRILSKNQICAWIIDLRRNTGGNAQLMIDSLAPFFGSEKFGFSLYPLKDGVF